MYYIIYNIIIVICIARLDILNHNAMYVTHFKNVYRFLIKFNSSKYYDHSFYVRYKYIYTVVFYKFIDDEIVEMKY